MPHNSLEKGYTRISDEQERQLREPGREERQTRYSKKLDPWELETTKTEGFLSDNNTLDRL